MPIKPENRALYPADWQAIRERILERDGRRCQFCGVEHRAIGWRDDKGAFHVVALDGNRQRLAEEQFTRGDLVRLILIVLTIAHLHDMDPRNCADDNLAALCQRCHNRHDLAYRQANARRTRAAKSGTPDLFPVEHGGTSRPECSTR